jgi:uncharacterized protein YfiM (DUF2279 family)
MHFLLLPLLMLAADTGRTSGGAPLAAAAQLRTAEVSVFPPATLAIYAVSAINREGTRTALPAAPASPPPQDRWVGEDKFKHLAFSYVVTAGTFGVSRLAADHDASITIGAIAGAAAGIGKEIYDARRQGASFRDLAWDALGVAAAVLIAQETR